MFWGGSLFKSGAGFCPLYTKTDERHALSLSSYLVSSSRLEPGVVRPGRTVSPHPECPIDLSEAQDWLWVLILKVKNDYVEYNEYEPTLEVIISEIKTHWQKKSLLFTLLQRV